MPALAASPGEAESAAEAISQDSTSELLRERIETLIVRLDEAATRPLAVAPGIALGAAAETSEERARFVEENQAAALDRSLTTENRLQALRELRSRDGRSREVTLAMLEIIEDPATPPNLRADIIRNLHGVAFDELEAPLLRILSEDPDPETRAETVETLDLFYDRPHVYAAVVQVRDSDKDPRVRAEAFERLARYEPIRLR